MDSYLGPLLFSFQGRINRAKYWIAAIVYPALLDGVGRTMNSPIVFGLASLAVSIWAIVELGFLRGTTGPNQYGPDPLVVA